jgi:hypothetical protein
MVGALSAIAYNYQPARRYLAPTEGGSQTIPAAGSAMASPYRGERCEQSLRGSLIGINVSTTATERVVVANRPYSGE